MPNQTLQSRGKLKEAWRRKSHKCISSQREMTLFCSHIWSMSFQNEFFLSAKELPVAIFIFVQ